MEMTIANQLTLDHKGENRCCSFKRMGRGMPPRYLKITTKKYRFSTQFSTQQTKSCQCRDDVLCLIIHCHLKCTLVCSSGSLKILHNMTNVYHYLNVHIAAVGMGDLVVLF